MFIIKLIAISVLALNLWIINQPCSANDECSVMPVCSTSSTQDLTRQRNAYWENHLDVVLGDVENDKIYKRFAKGQCTWYAWGRFKEVHHKNIRFKTKLDIDAKKWPDLILNCRIDDKPEAQSIAISTLGQYGHLIFIEHIDDGMVYYTEANGDGNNRYDRGEDCKLKKTALDSEFMQGFTKFVRRQEDKDDYR